MPLLTETFGRHGELVRLAGRDICRADLRHSDVLLVRSVTRVDRDLLHDSGVRFVGSATIGIDHLDTAWLESNSIAWAHAPGCNADAAAQYTLAMMMLACERLNMDFNRQRIGIIGRGNVGRRIEHLLTALDIPVMACDPPLFERGEQNLVSMDEACSNSIISLHVPLTSTGKYPTIGLLDASRLDRLGAGTLLVNTSRGAVIEKYGLLAQLQASRLHAALDVWPDEPFIGEDLLEAVTVATPHVAGYSMQGKMAGTEMIYRAFCKVFALATDYLPDTSGKEVTLCFPPLSPANEVLGSSLESSCPIARDDAALRAAPRRHSAAMRVQIDALRADYPERHEFKSHLIRGLSGTTAHLAGRLGFKTA